VGRGEPLKYESASLEGREVWGQQEIPKKGEQSHNLDGQIAARKSNQKVKFLNKKEGLRDALGSNDVRLYLKTRRNRFLEVFVGG